MRIKSKLYSHCGDLLNTLEVHEEWHDAVCTSPLQSNLWVAAEKFWDLIENAEVSADWIKVSEKATRIAELLHEECMGVYAPTWNGIAADAKKFAERIQQ